MSRARASSGVTEAPSRVERRPPRLEVFLRLGPDVVGARGRNVKPGALGHAERVRRDSRVERDLERGVAELAHPALRAALFDVL